MDRLAKMTAFAKVAETGSFTKAARALRLSPTIISKHVRELEEALGVRLLNRTTRHVGLTEIGGIYYEQCADLLTQLEALENITGELQNTPTGVLRVSTPLGFGTALIAPLLPTFSAAYPKVTVELILTDRYVDVVEEGFDMAVTMNQLPESSYITRTLSNTGTVLCAAPEYLARHGAPATPEDLAGHNCLVVANAPLGVPWSFTGADGVAHAIKVGGNLRTNSATVQLQAALGGQGIALQPDFLVAQALRDGRMVRVLPDYATTQIIFRMVYPPGRHLTAKLRAFTDFLVANLSS
ncbi:MAG: LysR family transcriptional regulator [Bryobacteraceae bacterium]|nr:LysR family transcriptional regulator [Bryobacteraceae bacterium]